MGVTLCLSVASTMTAFAGWEQTGTTWKYKDDSTGVYLANGWNWIDGNHDNIAECYYLDNTGVMVSNTIIEGYTINDLGQWTVNGVVQTKTTQAPEPTQSQVQPTEPTVNESNNTTELSPEMQERQRLLDERKAQGKGSITHEVGEGHGGDSLKDAEVVIGGGN